MNAPVHLQLLQRLHNRVKRHQQKPKTKRPPRYYQSLKDKHDDPNTVIKSKYAPKTKCNLDSIRAKFYIDKLRLDRTVKSKPVLGVDDLLLLLNCYQAYNKSVYPTEQHWVQFALILLLLFSTGCRPRELVDAKRKRRDNPSSNDDNPEDDVDIGGVFLGLQRGYNGGATTARVIAQRLSQPKWGKAVPGTRGVMERGQCYKLRAAPNNPVAHLSQAQSCARHE
ncbi:hypothetical protein V502_05162 [Pseudogymnoascus sp. VKM F-4520 (FW-2644)]|nr:hypothetical protein V502_05162 [Pseudogymnoascus sp. VKM F-4520 (FW-2644)]